MKKVLATLVLAFSLTGIYVSADGRELPRQTSVQEMSVISGSLNSLILQNGRRRRRWRRNNGNGNGNWNRRRWMRRRGNDNWHRRGRRGRGRRGGDHGEDHD